MKKPDIIETLTREGLELQKHGTIYTAKCCFHDEKTASFTVWPGKQRFECFGCGASGDVISFIQKKYNLSFMEAKNRLLMAKESPSHTRARETKQDLLKRFRGWEKNYFTKLCLEYRMLLYEIDHVRDEWELEIKFGYYHRLPVVEWKLDVLIEGSEQDKLELWRRMRC